LKFKDCPYIFFYHWGQKFT